jgi:hypothetical protein
MVSVRNLALFGTDWFGSKLLDVYHFSFGSLVVANSATTAIVIPLVFLLPAIIVGRKDAEVVGRKDAEVVGRKEAEPVGRKGAEAADEPMAKTAME